MKIVGFPVDVSRSLDGRIVRGLRTRQSLIQATLDLIQAGDVEPTSAAIATIAGVSRQPEAQPRLFLIMFIIIGLVEGMYFINLAFGALFVFSLGAK